MFAILWKWKSLKKEKEQQRAPLTCHHCVDNGCASLLPISEDGDGVHVLHARSQARHNNASRVWGHFSRGFPALAWSDTQLEDGKQNKHQGQIFPELGYCRGAVVMLRRTWKPPPEVHNVLFNWGMSWGLTFALIDTLAGHSLSWGVGVGAVSSKITQRWW